MNVRAGAADDRGNFSQKPRAIARANHELHLERGGSRATPLDSDAAFCLIQQILHVRAQARMNGHAAPAGGVSADVVAGNWISAFCAIHVQSIIALDDERVLAK